MHSNIIKFKMDTKMKLTHNYYLSYFNCPETVKYTTKYKHPTINTNSTALMDVGNRVPTITAIVLMNCTLISTLVFTKAPD